MLFLQRTSKSLGLLANYSLPNRWEFVRELNGELQYGNRYYPPGMNGESLFQVIRETDETLAEKVIFITGDVISASTQAFIDSVENPVVRKPQVVRCGRASSRDSSVDRLNLAPLFPADLKTLNIIVPGLVIHRQ